MCGNLKLSEAFGMADNILTTAAKGIAELITVTGYINVDFEDVKTVMKNSGTAIMGSAEADGEKRAEEAVEAVLESPLLNDNKISGASNILLYISSGKEEITFDEVTTITKIIQSEAGVEADVIWGNGFDESLDDKISITLIATGFKAPEEEEITDTTFEREKEITIFQLKDELPNPTNSVNKSVAPKSEKSTEKVNDISEITLIKKNTGKPKKDKNDPTSAAPSLFDTPLPFETKN